MRTYTSIREGGISVLKLKMSVKKSKAFEIAVESMKTENECES